MKRGRWVGIKNKLVSRLFADTIVPIGLVRSVGLSTVLLPEHSPEVGAAFTLEEKDSLPKMELESWIAACIQESWSFSHPLRRI